MIAFAALLSGSGVGFTLGLIGGGGSILATPLLLYVVGIAQPHLAIGTGALAVAANAFLTLLGHARAGNVRWRCAAVFALVGILGAFVGSSLGKAVDGQRLLFLFALLMIVVGIHMLRGRRVQGGTAEPVGCGPVPSGKVVTVAFAVGVLSGFFGIGGGFLIVPGLVFATGMPLITAVGTSLLAVGVFGLATALNYAVSGLVDWVVAGEFVAGGLFGGFLGMRLASRLAGLRGALNTVFATVIFGVAAYMLYRNASAFSAPS